MSTFIRLLIESTLALFLSSVDRKHSRPISLSVCLPPFVCWSENFRPISLSVCLLISLSVSQPSFVCWSKDSRPLSLSVCLPSLVCSTRQVSVSLPPLSCLLNRKLSHSSPLSVFTCLTNQETIAPLLSSALAC